MPFPKEQTCKTHASKSQKHKTPRDHKRAFEVDRPMKRHRLIYPHQMNVDTVDAQCDLTASFSTTDNNPRFLIELSDDITSRILFSGFLENSPHQLLKTTSTCKRFQALAKTYVVSLNAHQGKRYKQPTAEMITGILLRFNHLQEVDFSGCWNFGNQHLELLEPIRNTLRVLRLKDTQITDAGIMTFFEYDKHSVSLNMMNLFVSNHFSVPIIASFLTFRNWHWRRNLVIRRKTKLEWNFHWSILT